MQCRPKDGRPLSSYNKAKYEEHLAAIAAEVAQVLKRAAPATSGTATVRRLPPEDIALAKLPSTSSDLFGRDEQLAALDRGRRVKAPTCGCFRLGYDLEIMADRTGTAIGGTTRSEGRLPCETLAEKLRNTR
jgi:hypothetical protein